MWIPIVLLQLTSQELPCRRSSRLVSEVAKSVENCQDSDRNSLCWLQSELLWKPSGSHAVLARPPARPTFEKIPKTTDPSCVTVEYSRTTSLVVIPRFWPSLRHTLVLDCFPQDHSLGQLVGFLPEELLPRRLALRCWITPFRSQIVSSFLELVLADENIYSTSAEVDSNPVTIAQHGEVTTSRGFRASVQNGG